MAGTRASVRRSNAGPVLAASGNGLEISRPRKTGGPGKRILKFQH